MMKDFPSQFTATDPVWLLGSNATTRAKAAISAAGLALIAGDHVGAADPHTQYVLKSSIVLNILDFAGADRTGATSNVGAFQLAMALLSSLGGGTLWIPFGTYLFTITGDSDTIQIPSNVYIQADRGTVFKWGYWGSPLLAIVNQANVEIDGISIEWSGTFGTTSGSRSFAGYSRSVPAHQWCCNIAMPGSDNCYIRRCRTYGATTSNCINISIYQAGKSDGVTPSKNNNVIDCVTDDCSQGIMWEGSNGFLIYNLTQNRYSNLSNGLYGPGHLIYFISPTACTDGIVQNLKDVGVCNETAPTTGAHTLSCKNFTNVIVDGVISHRAAGILNWTQCNDSSFTNFLWSASNNDVNARPVYYTGQGTSSNSVRFSNFSIKFTNNTSTGGFLFCCDIGSNIPSQITVNNFYGRRYIDGTESSGMFVIGCTDSYFDFIAQQDGTATFPKPIVQLHSSSTRNLGRVVSLGAVGGYRYVVTGGGANNRFIISSIKAEGYDAEETGTTNYGVREASPRNQGRHTFSSGANPTFTFPLPIPGTYLVHVNLLTTDFNHSLAGTWLVTFDDASTNDYTSVQLIGTQITKGASAPTALGITVSNAGVITMTSTAAVGTYYCRYGYHALYATS